ncbi:restriction endonuclease subunit S [Streptomyces sp. NPDC058694]|uniref:restriction endonuclease subunit S n=1 Tax=Streptomyces sp. NPDC058694 TaxID=3346603 RepID=UPI00365902E2
MRGEVALRDRGFRAAGWRYVPLKDVGTWLSGGTPSTSNDAYWGGDIPWISGASMKSFRITDSDRKLTDIGAKNGSRLVSKGTTLFVVRGMSLKSEFRVGVTERTVAFGQDCKAIIPAEGIDPEFLARAVQSRTSEILTLVEETSHGTGRLDTARLQELEIPVPSLDEQHRIVAAHAAFERRIGALERMLGKLRVAEEALSAEALAPRFGWEYATVEDIADVAAGVTLGAEPLGEGTVELPYLRVANVLDGRIDTADVKRVRIVRSQLERFALRKGDLLLTEGGDLDKLGRGAVWDGRIEPCLHQNHVFRVRCGSRMDPDFLALYTASPKGRAYFQRVGKQTTNLASINSTQVKAMRVPVPPLEAQRRNLEPVRAVRVRMRAVERQIAKLRTIQQGVVEDLLAGRVRLAAA